VDLFRCVTEARPALITPESVRRTLAVLERCRSEMVR
jgi:hypothetical protein